MVSSIRAKVEISKRAKENKIYKRITKEILVEHGVNCSLLKMRYKKCVP